MRSTTHRGSAPVDPQASRALGGPIRPPRLSRSGPPRTMLGACFREGMA